MSTEQSEVYDLLGIGFGPANLALAIALVETADAVKQLPRIHFLERQPHFAWHPTLLLPGASLQVSPLKDLATMRDPTSSFSFINYLHKTNRLVSFINKENQVPSRREWSAYLAWAAQRMDEYASYDQEVISIEPVHPSTETESTVNDATFHSVRILKVTSRAGKTGEVVHRLTRNITIAVGGVASIPAQVAPFYPANPWTENSLVVHSSTFLPSLSKIDAELKARMTQRLSLTASRTERDYPLRLAVLGSGQSAAEMASYLHSTYPQAHVTMIFRASAIVPSDDSAFVNSAAFDPDRTDTFWKASEAQRSEWRKEFRRTNYSVVRPDVLNHIHTVIYDQQIELPAPFPGAAGPSQGYFEIKANTTVIGSERVKGTVGDEFELNLINKLDVGKTEVARYDAIFLGTGFNRSPKQLQFLEPLAKFYPALDPQSRLRTAMSGSSTPDQIQDEASMCGTEEEAERARERQRGITRDYRLVSVADPAFAAEGQLPTSVGSPARRRSGDSDGQPSAYSRSSSVGGLSLVSSTSTLNESDGLSRSGSPNTTSASTPSVYLMGCNEATHGLSDSLLSIVAFRASEITQSLLERSAAVSSSSPSSRSPSGFPALHEEKAAESNDETLLKQASRKANATLHQVADQLHCLQSSVTA
ncbi:unnamed protein product [Tilletia laevis]|uniref:L-ornithine N(5)-monooxygenase [NAD(P)H] n=3 Tax=Tilletia TaxID=13289 RepID=A0A8X7SV98_9BASI|nr:hypothetical protein CF336_g5728 [Tilletia laevis]KAE8243778.1 hypothetical protein A4X06_0g6110 [Tilletia controversa]KAE8256765.1 hypothetical protein A4X03_0g5078 [Tilletia caries]KAE8195852.1 hypothetical protein CF335_g4995 [Tilletia laevis]CAD6891815.1 unnamed protein product [Tilletia caries]